MSSRLCEQSIIDIWTVAIPNLNFHKKLSTLGYSNRNETVYFIEITTVYFIEITRITDATGECKRNSNPQEKLNMRPLESPLDHNLLIACIDSSLKTWRWCSNSASLSSLIPLSLFSPQKKHCRLFCAVVIRSPSIRHYRFAKL